MVVSEPIWQGWAFSHLWKIMVLISKTDLPYVNMFGLDRAVGLLAHWVCCKQVMLALVLLSLKVPHHQTWSPAMGEACLIWSKEEQGDSSATWRITWRIPWKIPLQRSCSLLPGTVRLEVPNAGKIPSCIMPVWAGTAQLPANLLREGGENHKWLLWFCLTVGIWPQGSRETKVKYLSFIVSEHQHPEIWKRPPSEHGALGLLVLHWPLWGVSIQPPLESFVTENWLCSVPSLCCARRPCLLMQPLLSLKPPFELQKVLWFTSAGIIPCSWHATCLWGRGATIN